MGKIRIFDTTLRDGEQTPGVCLELNEKVEIALALEKLGVDVIEAGFPIASPGDFAAVEAVAKAVKKPVVAALARAAKNDIDRAWEAVKAAQQPCIHTFLATSDIHLKHKLKMSRQEALERIDSAVRYACSLTPEVEFSAEDASRSDWDFLCQAYRTAIRAGAKTVNVPDTVGYTLPEEFAKLIRYLRAHIADANQAVFSVHCHNDLGMAVANSLAAVGAGATQIECTINGLGERAGNAALEEIVMALATRNDFYQMETGIQSQQLYRTSRLVSTFAGIVVQPNKSIVGDNAFAHESGIHQHGMLNHASTYEIISPASVGMQKTSLVLGKHSGRHAVEDRLKELGYELSAEKLDEVFGNFKTLADKKKQIFDRDLEALVGEGQQAKRPEWFRLQSHQVSSGSDISATAAVKIESSSGVVEKAACGDGPVDAVFHAINAAVGFEVDLKDYQLRSVTAGQDAMGEASVSVRQGSRSFNGRGVSTDVVEASAKAYLNALNKMISECGVPAAKEAG